MLPVFAVGGCLEETRYSHGGKLCVSRDPLGGDVQQFWWMYFLRVMCLVVVILMVEGLHFLAVSCCHRTVVDANTQILFRNC